MAVRLDGAPANTNQSIPELVVGGCGIAHASWRDNRHHAVVGDPLLNLYTRSFAAELPQSQPGDITGDGEVDVDDLLAVITNWGPCPAPPAACPADIAPAGAPNGVVNVDDLLMVVTNWG